jgi:S-DNA-T family DNA segregation ATPase FtsK/SpoIIIE
MLPDAVALCDLLPPGGSMWPVTTGGSLGVPLGLDVDELEPIMVDVAEGPHFLVTGPVQSGKTSLLQSWILALAESYPPDRLQLFPVDFRHSGLMPLRRLPQVRGFADEDETLGDVLAEIAHTLRERRTAIEEARQAAGGTLDQAEFLAQYPALVMVIDDYDALRDMAQPGTKERLEQIVRRERGLRFHQLKAG